MKIVKRIVIIVVTILLVLMLAFNVYNFFCIHVLRKDLPSIGGYAMLEVVSGSMEPTIHVGDIIVINTNSKHYQAQDIVTFYDIDGSFVTHRILSIDNEEMITKGDNNNTEDEPISVDNLVGKYVFRINGAGRLMSSFKSPFVMVMIFLIGVMACYLLSTDKKGDPILSEEEKEFLEFQKYKENKEKAEKESAIQEKETRKQEKKNKKSSSKGK